MNKHVIAVVLVVVVALENYFWPGLVYNTWNWTAGWLPWYLQLVLFAVVVVTVLIAVSMPLAGWLIIIGLMVLVMMPLTGIDLGPIDSHLDQVAHQIAKNPNSSREVYGIFTWLHYAFLAVVGLGALGLLTAAVNRLR